MATINIRNVPSEILAQIDVLKGEQSREAFLRQKLAEIAAAGEVPPPRHGKGIRAFTEDGGRVHLTQYIEYVGHSAVNLTQEQFDVYQRAHLLASPKNGGRWAEAISLLKEAGFEVFWD